MKSLLEKLTELQKVLNAQTNISAYSLVLLDDIIDDVSSSNFKFDIGQEVWFLKNDKIRKGTVRVRQVTQSSLPLIKELNYFNRSINEKRLCIYSLNKDDNIDENWQLLESSLFASKQELLDYLAND